MADDTEKRFLTPKAAAAILGLSGTKIYSMLNSGELPSVKLGTARNAVRRIPASAIDQLEAQAFEKPGSTGSTTA